MDYDQAASSHAIHRAVHPGVLARLRELARPAPTSRILEIGCGTGNYVSALARSGGRALGIDPSRRMLEVAARLGGFARVCLGVAEDLPVADACIDFAFSVDVIHHVRDVERTFHEGRRILRNGGRLCTITDSEWIIRNRVPLSRYFPETVASELARYPGIPALRAAMESAGLAPIAEELVERAYEIDGLEAFEAKAFSALQLLDEAAFERGLARMRRDLERGPIRCVSRYAILWGEA